MLLATLLLAAGVSLEIAPQGTADMTGAVMDAVDAARAAGGGEIRFAKGAYHFRSPSRMRFFVSNHDNPDPRNVFVPLTNVTDVALVSGGADFVFHGEGVGLMLSDARNVTVRGIRLDYAVPFFTEARFMRYDGGCPVVRTAPPQFALAVEDGRLVSVGDRWKGKPRLAGVFSGKSGVFGGWRWFDGKATDLGGGVFRIEDDWRKVRFAAPPEPDDVIQIRDGYRPNPTVFVCRARGTVFEDCVIHSSAGIGILAQRSENITVRGSGRAEERKAGSFVKPGAGRLTSLQADATHFSNCKGKITVENCLFEGMSDDAINVHSTCLMIETKPAADRILCRYKHKQSVGFEVFLPGESLRYIRARTLETVEKTVKVMSAEMTAFDMVELTLAEPVPAGIGVGDAVENADWQPAVDFKRNIVRNSTPRATLFTTPGRVLCEGNLFDHVAGQAVHMSADARDWYESGACSDVTVRGNVFRDCMICGGKGVIQIDPNVKDLKAQKARYHRNILIEDNVFEQEKGPLVFARSVSNLVWRANRVTGDKSFDIEFCEGVKFDEP